MKISNRNPQPYYLPNPTGLNAACQIIQKRLQDNVSWLAYSFGRAYKIHRDLGADKQESKTRPHAYMGNREYYELMPNDSLKSFAFMTPIGKAEPVDYEENTISQFYKRKVALIIWGNLKEIDDDRDEVFTDDLQYDVIQQLKKISQVNSVQAIEDEDITEIFKPFSADKFHQALYYPYFAIRLEIEISYYLGDC